MYAPCLSLWERCPEGAERVFPSHLRAKSRAAHGCAPKRAFGRRVTPCGVPALPEGEPSRCCENLYFLTIFTFLLFTTAQQSNRIQYDAQNQQRAAANHSGVGCIQHGGNVLQPGVRSLSISWHSREAEQQKPLRVLLIRQPLTRTL